MGKWSKNGCIKSASNYATKDDWIRFKKTAYLAARDNGWINICCEHMEKETTNVHDGITLSQCRKSAENYTSMQNWKKGDKELYFFAIEQGWITSCCKHMVEIDLKMDKKDFFRSALVCNSYSEWMNSDSLAYKFALKHNWTVEIKELFLTRNVTRWFKSRY